ncbi:hypothetical protein [Sphingomonas gilva]|uniref:hypothetical protein n=1 Tax=Sphingomonas gilva TaxID=2305907 RepID=UPI0011C49B0C|nr:hypothetical protein [Sphingomonas gilva]
MFSIEGLGDDLFAHDLETLSQKFIDIYRRQKRYSSFLRFGNEVIIYGHQTISGILLDYTNFLQEIDLGTDSQLLIDGYSFADVKHFKSNLLFDFGADNAGNRDIFSINIDECKRNLVSTIYRISFGLYILDMSEVAGEGKTLCL